MTDWSLVVCGDWAPLHEYHSTILADPAKLYGDLLPVLKDADLAIVNLEGVISDQRNTPIVKDGICMSFPSEVVLGLTVVPFQLACLANNHTLDYGMKGLAETKNNLTAANIRSIGAGFTPEEIVEPKFYVFGETRFAVLNVAEGEEGRFTGSGPGVAPLDLPSVCRQITATKSQADVLLVIVHAGREHLPAPAPYIRDHFHALVDAGADFVIGHHPHVPQGIETYKGALIAYSLGNFVLWIDGPMDFHRLGYFVKLRFHNSELSASEVWPYRIDVDRVRLLQGQERVDFMSKLDQLSQLISTSGKLEAIWDGYADRWLDAGSIAEILDSVAILSGPSKLVETFLRIRLLHHAGNKTFDRLARAILLRILHWVEMHRRKIAFETEGAKEMAAILRNRFDTPAHKELYLTALKRVMENKTGTAPAWVYQLMDGWKVF